MDPNGKTPYSEEYNLALEHGFSQNMAATIAYVGSQSHHLVVFTNPNAPLALQTIGANQSVEQPLTGFGSSIFSSYSGAGNYNSLQATLERRFATLANFLATYTFSHSLDDAATPLGSNGDNGYPNTNIQPIRAQYSNSAFDTRQRFTFNGNFQLPLERLFAAGRGEYAGRLLGGWSVSLTFVAQLGNPFSVTPDFSIFPRASGTEIVYANRVAPPFKPGGVAPASNPGIACAASVRTNMHWYNPCAFGNPLSGAAIAAGQSVSGPAALDFLGGRRNDVYGPGYHRINLSLFKDLHVVASKTLQLRVDAFNLGNTPSYANPNSNATGGGLQAGDNTNSSNGGQITLPRFFQNFTPDARFFQVSAKLSY
jgi:hypothetical protein